LKLEKEFLRQIRRLKRRYQPQKTSVKEKYKMIQKALSNPKNHLSISMMFKELHVSRSGFYNYLNYQKNPTIKELKDQEDFKLIKQTYDYRNRHKGARQIKITLSNTFDIKMNLKKIRHLMKKYGLYCPIRKANHYRRMIKAMKTNNYAFNKLNRNFKSFKQVEHLLILFIVLDIGYTLKYL
jgi:hypothetical protein